MYIAGLTDAHACKLRAKDLSESIKTTTKDLKASEKEVKQLQTEFAAATRAMEKAQVASALLQQSTYPARPAAPVPACVSVARLTLARRVC